MLRCSVTRNGNELCLIEIEFVDGTTAQGDYAVRFISERGTAIGIHARTIHDFPRTKYNSLGLLLQALQTLDESELQLESDYSRHMARQQRGDVPEIQGGES